MVTEFEVRHTPKEEQKTFLSDEQVWSEELARELACTDGIGELTEAHWRVIYFLRTHFIEHGALPPMSHVCHAVGLDDHCVRRLFGGSREAWRTAGLPDPGEEAKTYMD